MSVAARTRGFTLLEAVIASALLLVAITAVTACVTSVSRAGARVEREAVGRRAARTVAARLLALPFCADAYPQTSAQPSAAAGDLVGAVFPHAVMERNTATARYVAGDVEPDIPAGSFVSAFAVGGGAVTCVARFLRAPEGPALAPADLAQWDASVALSPPAPSVRLALFQDGTPVATFVRTATASPSAASPPAGSSVAVSP